MAAAKHANKYFISARSLSSSSSPAASLLVIMSPAFSAALRSFIPALNALDDAFSNRTSSSLPPIPSAFSP